MAWAALTAADVKTRLSGSELSLLQTASLASGQGDPLPDVLTQATDLIRGYVAADGRNALGPAGTIPPQLRGAAIAIARWYLAGRAAVGSNPTLMQGESRKKEYDDALGLLKDVAAGKFAVEQPDPSAVGPEVMSATDAKYGGAEKEDFLGY